MIQRLFYSLNPTLWVRRLAVYGSGRLWQEVGHQARRSRWAEVSAAIAFLWLLGWLGLGFVLLHLEQGQTPLLPQGLVTLAQGLAAQLAVTLAPASPAAVPSRWGLGAVGLLSWLCLLSGTSKLVGLVQASDGLGGLGATQGSRWRSRLLPWGLTLLGLGLTGWVINLVDGGGLDRSGAAGLPLLLAELGRWLVALVSTGLGLGLSYRLMVYRWPPRLPLWPGVNLTMGLGLGLLGLRSWGLGWLDRAAIAWVELLAIGLQLAVVYLLVLLVPLGAQVNLGLLRHRGGAGIARSPWGLRSTAPPPPSFDSFKINRRS